MFDFDFYIFHDIVALYFRFVLRSSEEDTECDQKKETNVLNVMGLMLFVFLLEPISTINVIVAVMSGARNGENR